VKSLQRYVLPHTTQLSVLPIFRIRGLRRPAVSVQLFRDTRADSSILNKANTLVTLVNINYIRFYHTLHYFFFEVQLST
jgi:hypothetical protein